MRHGMASTYCPFHCRHDFTTDYLPVGTPQHQRREDADHWTVTCCEAHKQKYIAVLRRIRIASKKCEKKEAGVMLDGPLLLQIHCVDEPFQLCSVDISDRNLSSVKPEDFKVFENVAYIDASINSLSLGSFSCFASLRELNLSLNGICKMTFDVTSFPHLEVLNLSYNSLSPEEILSLGRLPHLKALHLTGNHLSHLPPNLGSSKHDSTQLPTEDKLFEVLEVLMLDDNKLPSEVFHSLTNLKRLKYLNLQKNNISEIPYMQVTSSSKDVQIPVEEEADMDANMEERLKVLKSFYTLSWEENYTRSTLPLPNLQFLNLAENKIAKEEGLIPAALFPMLCEINMHSNPLTTKRREDSSLLTNYLQKRLGVKINWKKTKEVVWIPLTVSTDSHWKVQMCEETVKRTTGPKRRSRGIVQKTTECTFITQAKDELEFEFSPSSEEQSSRTSHKQPTGWEKMMDVKPSPKVLKHVGISTAVRMLEHSLRSFNVYREPKPECDSIQAWFRRRKKKILPPPIPKHSDERIDEMIEDLRNKYTNKCN